MFAKDLYWMTQAYALALKAQECGEVPVGSVLVNADGNLLGDGYNQVITQNDPCAHAEILAIRAASEKLKNYRLLQTTLYVTLEPCLMCAGAIIQARVSRLVFATRDLKCGAAGSVYNFFQDQALNHHLIIDDGLLQQECANLLHAFFAKLRL